MKTAEQLRIDYYKKIMEDEKLVNILDEITETLYTQVIEENKTHLHRRYVIDLNLRAASPCL